MVKQKIQTLFAIGILIIGICLSVVIALSKYEEPCVPGMKLVLKTMCCNLNKTMCWEGDVKVYLGNETNREEVRDYECHAEYHTEVIICGGEGLTEISLYGINQTEAELNYNKRS